MLHIWRILVSKLRHLHLSLHLASWLPFILLALMLIGIYNIQYIKLRFASPGVTRRVCRRREKGCFYLEKLHGGSKRALRERKKSEIGQRSAPYSYQNEEKSILYLGAKRGSGLVLHGITQRHYMDTNLIFRKRVDPRYSRPQGSQRKPSIAIKPLQHLYPHIWKYRT